MHGFDLTEHLLVAAVVLGITAALIAWWHFLHRPKGSKYFRTGHATVVSRRVDQKAGDMRGLTAWMYLVTFDLGAQLIELQVSEADYRRLKEGISGRLEWRYEFLVSFDPDISDS